MAAGWRHRSSTVAFERGGLVSFAILVVYLLLAPSFITDGDNAEFSTLSFTGGVGHPPGYPAYVLYLRAFSWLPGSGAHAASLATAMLGAATAFVLHQACTSWGARPGAASIAVAIVSASPVVIRLHTAAEVFAMNDLVVALVIWLAAANGPLRGTRRAFVLALVAGLGLANQHTCVLIAPVGLLGLVRSFREADSRRASIGVALGGLVLGLSPYVYLLVAPISSISWGHPSSVSELLGHFTRKDYGGIGAFSPVPGEVDIGANIKALLQTLGRAWLWGPAGLGVAVLVVRSFRKVDEGEPRWGWAMLAASFLLAGPILIARFNVPPVGIGLFICQRFSSARRDSDDSAGGARHRCGSRSTGRARRCAASSPSARSRGHRGRGVRSGGRCVVAACARDSLTRRRERRREYPPVASAECSRSRDCGRSRLRCALPPGRPRPASRRRRHRVADDHVALVPP
jgi:hypothetical protein